MYCITFVARNGCSVYLIPLDGALETIVLHD